MSQTSATIRTKVEEGKEEGRRVELTFRPFPSVLLLRLDSAVGFEANQKAKEINAVQKEITNKKKVSSLSISSRIVERYLEK